MRSFKKSMLCMCLAAVVAIGSVLSVSAALTVVDKADITDIANGAFEAKMPLGFSLDAQSVTAGEDIVLTVNVASNPGIACAKLGLYYERDYFAVESSENAKEVFTNAFYVASEKEQYPYVMVWAGASNSNENGKLVSVVIKTKETTPEGKYTFYIVPRADDVSNEEGINVPFTVENIEVEIKAKEGVEAVKAENPQPVFYDNDGYRVIGDFANFTKKNTFDATVYTDVADTQWYATEVASAYEYGLMLGKGSALFCPDMNITLAEGITLATRIHSLYYGGSGELKPTGADAWYTPYANYAKKRLIYSEPLLGKDFNRIITRKEFALLMANALPEEAYAVINDVKQIPDVNKNDIAYESVLKLYKAGIVVGNDEKLTFAPDKSIKRSEVAAIVNRIAVVENRKNIMGQ